MPCFHPLKGWPSARVNESGRRSMVFTSNEALMPESEPMAIPCGQCIGCRLEKSRQWAVRCMHESTLHLYNCFITLTISPEFIDPKSRFSKAKYSKLKEEGVCLSPASLVVADFQLFMKRFRKHISPLKIRFYHCGEYGDKNKRPHHHALIFGYDFPDKILLSDRGGYKLFRSPTLEELWPWGISSIGAVTYESAAYVSRYIMKKQLGEAANYGELKPPYTTMSRKPGIAGAWIRSFSGDVYPDDFVITQNGYKGKPPKFYDTYLENADGELYKKVKKQRIRRMREKGFDNLASFDTFKNRSRETIAMKRSNQLRRSIEE